MRTLYQTLERLALELPSYGNISQTTRTVTLIFHDEILYLPWNNRAVREKLSDPRTTQHLITLVLYEMQRHARVILKDFEPVEFDERAAVVQRAWDGLAVAPAWLAFESQIDKVVAHEATS